MPEPLPTSLFGLQPLIRSVLMCPECGSASSVVRFAVYSTYFPSRSRNSAMKTIKRILDVLFASLLLLITSPLLLLVAVLIKLESPGPIFFRQNRLGYRGEIFTILKLRSMKLHAVDTDGQIYLDDPNVTAVGRIIRRLKIDELPQAWNILHGDMSLVGPRPTLPEQRAGYTPEQARRLDVLPGLTGWAQVNGGVQLTWDERITLDLWYIDHWSLWLDVRILFMTLNVVLRGERRSAEVSL